MKIRKLLEKLDKLTSKKHNTSKKKQIRKLREVLEALKEKQEHLLTKLDQEEDESKRRKIQLQFDVIRLQREKGMQVYKSLRDSLDETDDQP